MERKDPLMQPYQLKHLTLKNRMISTAHEPAYSEDGLPKARYRHYHAERAKGGIAMVMTAGSALVSRDSPAAFGNLHAYDDAIVPWLRELVEACHVYDCKVMIQLTHLGRRTHWKQGEWLPILAPSVVREPAHRALPKQAEIWDLERIVADYASAAARMQAAGLDGIELEAYGHLMDGFWSPATNQREDEFGGNLANRMRFSRWVLDAIRAACGNDFIVGIRMVVDEHWERGLSRAEGLSIAQAFRDSGQVDFLNVIRGHIDTDAALADVIPLHGTPAAPHLDFVGEVREATGLPTLHAARINDVATARYAISAGKVDLVGMTRAHIADPHIVNKILAGAEHRIRPCVGATYCLDRIYEGGDALCIHNASTGREAQLPHEIIPASKRRSVLIIGAGIAGLEAARVCAERGHSVTVWEANKQAGGQVALLARDMRRREMLATIDWRLAECERLGVRFEFNHYAEAQDVFGFISVGSERPVVLIATGGLPDMNLIPSLDAQSQALLISSWDILADELPHAAQRKTALLYDENGAHPGLQAAEKLLRAGWQVEIVTPERFFAPEVGGLNHAYYAAVLEQFQAKVTLHKRLMKVRKSAQGAYDVTLGSDYAAQTQTQVVDLVVAEVGTLPLDQLYHELVPQAKNAGAVDYAALLSNQVQHLVRNPAGQFELYRLGDAVSGRNIHAAVLDARRLCGML